MAPYTRVESSDVSEIRAQYYPLHLAANVQLVCSHQQPTHLLPPPTRTDTDPPVVPKLTALCSMRERTSDSDVPVAHARYNLPQKRRHQVTPKLLKHSYQSTYTKETAAKKTVILVQKLGGKQFFPSEMATCKTDEHRCECCQNVS